MIEREKLFLNWRKDFKIFRTTEQHVNLLVRRDRSQLGINPEIIELKGVKEKH